MSIHLCNRCGGSGERRLAGVMLDNEVVTAPLKAKCIECNGIGWIAVPDVVIEGKGFLQGDLQWQENVV